MQDCNLLGINAVADRKRFLMLTRSLRSQDSAPTSPRSGIPRSHTLDYPERPRRASTTSRSRPNSSYLENLELDHVDEEEDYDIQYTKPNQLVNAYGIPVATSNRTPSSSRDNLNQKIRVCVRKRPLSNKEIARNEKDITQAAGDCTIQVNEPKTKLDLTKFVEQHSFVFDEVFDAYTGNESIYERTALPLVKYVFAGGKATCFAYGQTGSGKTYTMLDPRRGLYVLAAQDIFEMLQQPQYEHLFASIGFYEIYQGQLYDLLNQRKRLYAREDGNNNVVIAGLHEYAINNVESLLQVFDLGSQARSTGATGANDSSSRSHAVLQILLKEKKSRKTIYGKLSFIDLAGSERGADRGDTDLKTRMEGAEINKSLLALKECIRALDQDKKHTPFRQSKLTQVLKDSFVGRSRTCMIATISPGSMNSEHTLNTLRYADRVKELKGSRQSTADTEAYGFGTSNVDNDDMEMQDYDSADEALQEEEYDSQPFMADDMAAENIFDQDFPYDDHELPSSQQPIPSPQASLSTKRYHVSSQDEQALRSPKKPLMRSSSSTLHSGIPRPGFYSRSNSGSSSPRQSNFREATPEPTSETPAFSYENMQEFVGLHRAEMREVNDCSKRENKLLANLTLYLNSQRERGAGTAMSQSFEMYLNELDEMLAHKMASIEALRDHIELIAERAANGG
ncbi:hypothetical protein NQZ79_g2228 [Umbelopsis isabellina]|nr:hypothetical protein NQZ79_g2228 [Umbelopsis isabellina]